MTTKHTPGPWKHTAYGCGFCIETLDFDEETSTGSIVARTSDSMPEADARLIAAAPELLEALQALVKWMDDSNLSWTKPGGVGPLRYGRTEYSVVTDARAALAKATTTRNP